jgi:hypothetical protein
MSPLPLLVVSLCDGIGSIYVTPERLKRKFRGLAAELDPHARALTRLRHRRVKVYDDALTFTHEFILQEYRKHRYAGILLTAGPPCSPFSSLGQQRGFDDAASKPLLHFMELKDSLEKACSSSAIDFRWLMEEVSSMPQDARETISARLGCSPILLNAADFGWVHRSRLYWGSRLPTSSWSEEVDILPAGKLIPDVAVMRILGTTLPPDLELADGFTLASPMMCGTSSKAVPGSDWAASHPDGRLLAVTTAFPHPADRGSAGGGNFQRFEADSRRFPLYSYAEGNLVWKGEACRPLNADEREQLHFLPKGYTSDITSDAGQSIEDKRCSFIGLGWHIPSILYLLLGMAMATTPVRATPLYTQQYDWPPGSWASTFTPNTIWADDPQGLEDVALPADCLLQASTCLMPLSFYPDDILATALQKLTTIRLHQLFRYHLFCRSSGTSLVTGLRSGGPHRQILTKLCHRSSTQDLRDPPARQLPCAQGPRPRGAHQGRPPDPSPL